MIKFKLAFVAALVAASSGIHAQPYGFWDTRAPYVLGTMPIKIGTVLEVRKLAVNRSGLGDKEPKNPNYRTALEDSFVEPNQVILKLDDGTALAVLTVQHMDADWQRWGGGSKGPTVGQKVYLFGKPPYVQIMPALANPDTPAKETP